jgi:hypothetical protein
LVQAAREHRRRPLDYALKADPVWMVTDGCATGISGVVSQGVTTSNNVSELSLYSRSVLSKTLLSTVVD